VKIVQLKAENVKRLKAVEITPDGNLVVVAGRNAQGKSSVLDSIEYALAGKRSLPGVPVRSGERKANIEIHLDGETPLIVKRSITPDGGGQLTITSPDGTKATSPQTLLDKLCGQIAFDPLAFSRMDPRKQAETLRGLVGLDFSALDAEARRVYDERTSVNREARSLQARIAGMACDPAIPDEEVSVADLIVEMKRRQEVNSLNREERDKVRAANGQVERIKFEIASMEEQLKVLRDQLVKAETLASRQAIIAETLQDEDVAEIEAQIKGAEMCNRAVREKQARRQVEAEHAAKATAADALTARLEEIAAEKGRLLASAKWPVPGLGFSDTGVTYNSLPFEQASGAEQLRVSVAIGAALNPSLRVLLVRDGSLLDQDSLTLLAQLAAQYDAQVWLEMVSGGMPGAIVIEDGEVSHG
jgi:DNA repair exonuclease SbcCD ATPase subunit